MANSTAIFSVRVAESAAGGADVNSSTFLPTPPVDNSASWIGMATTEASVDAMAGGEELFHEENHGRRSPGEDTLAAIGVKNVTGNPQFGAASGEFMRVMYTDSISINHRFRTAGGGDPLNQGFGTILGSSMGLHSPTQNTVTTSANAVGADGDTIVIATADVGAVAVGAPIRIRPSGGQIDEYAVITNISADDAGNTTLTVHPRFSRQIMANEAVQLCYAFFPIVGDNASGIAKRDLFVQFDMGGVSSDASVRRVAALCRCSGFTLANDNNGVGLTMNLRPGAILQDDANASTSTTSEPPGDLLQHRYGAEVVLGGNHAGVSGAVSGTRTALSNFDRNCEVTFDAAPSSPDTRGILRMSSMDINNATASISVTSEANETLQRMIARGERRTVILGMGPAGDGQGGAFILSNGGRADGAANPSGGENNLINQETALRAIAESDICNLTTGNAGVALTAAEQRLATAPFLLALPRFE